jgi:3-oxoacyl-[acyl-carrier-protein] synthase-3
MKSDAATGVSFMKNIGECYLRHIVAEYGSALRSNEDLVTLNPSWSSERILSKVGIAARRIAAPGETALDIGERAANRLLEQVGERGDIDVLIFVSQSPDYLLPSSACILQHRLGLSDRVAAFDVGLGCSGFNYSLWLARSLVLAGQAGRVLIVCAETYSRYCGPDDISTVTLFGDGASAAILQADPTGVIATIGDSVLGSDGSGAEDLMVKACGARSRSEATSAPTQPPILSMDGPNVFRFALDRVRPTCERLLEKLALCWDDIGVVLCHQANQFMLNALQKQLKLDDSRMPIDVLDIGNLSTASLPVHIARAYSAGRLDHTTHSLAVGFGVGLSWGATHILWHTKGIQTK